MKFTETERKRTFIALSWVTWSLEAICGTTWRRIWIKWLSGPQLKRFYLLWTWIFPFFHFSYAILTLFLLHFLFTAFHSYISSIKSCQWWQLIWINELNSRSSVILMNVFLSSIHMTKIIKDKWEDWMSVINDVQPDWNSHTLHPVNPSGKTHWSNNNNT